MKHFTKALLVGVVFALVATGCTERVPPGFIGMVMEPDGLTGDVLQPGNHSCYNRDRMVLLETKEELYSLPMSVLCADDLNFKFNLKMRARLKQNDSKGVLSVLKRQGAAIDWSQGDRGVLGVKTLMDTYLLPPAENISRGVVSKYETTQIRENREAIEKTIQEQLLQAISDTPVELMLVATANFDYPDVITDAVEKKRKKEIAIEEEKAKQAMALLQIENRRIIAQKAKMVRAAEAEAEATYVKILGRALTPEYLALRQRENNKLLYEKQGAGDTLIVLGGGTNVTPLVNVGK